MPIYKYRCPKCDNSFDVIHSMGEPPHRRCDASACAGIARRQVVKTSFALKGGGWYADGYTGGA